MIPKIIHYCWFGHGEMPKLAVDCIASWHAHMPDWEYHLWNEDNFSIDESPLYVRQAYETKKYAFVSDYVRLWALKLYGGLYLDTDVEVLRPFDELMDQHAFMGFEESLAHLPGTCVIGCEYGSEWPISMLRQYDNVVFIKDDGSYDLTTNVNRLGSAMMKDGLVPNGKDQVIGKWQMHVYSHDYFSPITSTRVMRKSKATYSIHHFAGSWNNKAEAFENSLIVREFINALVHIKRFFVRLYR